jgi:arginyl-tRNA synthetase
MKPYLLRNDNVQHEERLFLEQKFSERHGRPVTYKEILHELQRREVERLQRENV